MFCLSIRERLISVAIVAFGLVGCAADADEPRSSTDDEGSAAEVSSPLPLFPLTAFSEQNASFAGLGVGATAVGTVGASSTGGTTVGVGGFNNSFGTGPMTTGFNSGPMTTGFNSGPITTGFNSGPITTGGTTSISSSSGAAPVINSTCTGFGCP